MDDFAAHNSRWRLALLFLVAAGCVTVALWMVGAFGQAPGSRRYPAEFMIAAGWFCVIVFGLLTVFIAKRFFDGRTQLRIGRSGIQWTPWSDQVIPWSDVADVSTWSHNRQKFIILQLKDPDRFPGRGLAARFAKLNRKMTGGDICISLTGTDRSHAAALAAIEQFRDAFLRSPSTIH